MMRYWIIWLPLVLLIGLVARTAHADRIELKDGRVFEGLITDTRASSVTIEVVTSGIKAKLTFNRHEIASIDDTDTPPASPLESEAPPRQAPPATNTPPTPGANPSDTPKVFYAVIPLHGEFGAEIQAEGIRNALAKAKANDIGHIVFSINSPGGFSSEAMKVMEVLNDPDFRARFQYHAFVEKEAFSASIRVIFACNSITFSPASATGAAVRFSDNPNTGAAEVDAKLNSANTKKISAYAVPLGHSGDVIRAMIEMDASCYGWIDFDGRPHITTSPPTQGQTAKVIFQDSDKTVLSLTGSEAVESGIGRGFADDPSQIGDLLGIDNWTLVPGIGPPQMATVKREYLAEQRAKTKRLVHARKLNKMYPSALASLPALETQAVNADPNRFTYLYDTRTGLLTPQSQRDWRESTDRAITAWTKVGARAKDLRRISMELRGIRGWFADYLDCPCDLCNQLRVELQAIPDPIPFTDLMNRAESEIQRLRSQRERYYF